MKKHLSSSKVAFIVFMLFGWLNASSLMAQVKVADKEIIGTWIMTSMKYSGEGTNYISDKYTQVKVYRANGEYACAEIVKTNNGDYKILPHEYGTYSLKNNNYTEMGRKSGSIGWTSKTTFKGKWYNRLDEWEKATNMPASLVNHIVDKCKAAQTSPKNIQDMMKKYIFNK